MTEPVTAPVTFDETLHGRRRRSHAAAALDAAPTQVLELPPPPAERPATVLPRLALDENPADPGRVAVGFSRDDVLSVAGAGLAGLSVGLIFTVVLGIIPTGWLLVVSYVWFVALYAVIVFLRNPGPAVVDRFWSIMLWSAGAVVIASLALVIGFTLISGQDVVTQMFAADAGGLIDRLHFFWQDMGTVGPLAGLEQGGIFHALVGTIEQIGIALIITVPLGLTTAVYLGEVGGRLARFVRTIVEAMTALPSVVAGLFIYAAVIIAFTRQFNGFAAALAITVLMLPIMIRSADVVLRLVPGNLREAGLALGAGQWAVVWYVVLPTVRSGLTTAIILGTAHGIGETAPVLLTAGVTSNLNFDPFNGPMTSLPLAALEFVKAPQPEMRARGFATAAFLLVVVLVLFVIARIIGGQEAGTVSAKQRVRLTQRSRGTLARIQANRREHESRGSADDGEGMPPGLEQLFQPETDPPNLPKATNE
ncbi:PstA family ABC transporter permease [Herbiconiux ginsengi]|uniref:Phosphate transport system permease protein n=1 Tax=Herbiconiux ginsengi TaxID=381665 RepID=A0A1H3T5H1_9MICO|nr:PstA family ABC transporter permease [Herbiconiux ginsengi]SDZ45167.1 phosphate transport system permease protein [Herbiconiux ginsengi]